MLSLTYFSTANDAFDQERLAELLREVRPMNEASGLTGLLLYHDWNFIQTIEGPEDAVRSTFARIERDPRHRAVFIAAEEKIDERRFPDWSMSFRDLSGAAADELEGFSSFFTDARAGRVVPSDHLAHYLLRAFSRLAR